jgi:hypothetical protein
MRYGIWVAVLSTACAAPGDSARAPASPGRKYAGAWEGRSYRSEADTGTPFRLVASIAPDGTLRGTLTFTTIAGPPIPVRTRQVSDTALVDEIGPYLSPTMHRLVVTTTTGKLRRDSLNGTFETRPAEGGGTLGTGTFRSHRSLP